MRWSSKQGTKCTRGPPPRHPATTISTNTVWHTAVLLSPSPLKERLERAIKAGARPRVDAEVECDASRHVRFSSSNIARRVMARNTPRECWKRRAARALVEPADAAAANVRRYGEEPYAGGQHDPQNDSPSPLVPSLHGRDSLLQRLLIATLQHSAAPHPEKRWWSGERSRCVGAMEAGLEKEKREHVQCSRRSRFRSGSSKKEFYNGTLVQRKKENTASKGGMGERHAATTQGF